MRYLTFVLTSILNCHLVHSTQQTCDSPIYCQGDLLDTVQRAQIFNDSKTFVDMMQINSSNKTLENFERLKQCTNNNLTKDHIRKFVEDNFVMERELEPWTPPDYNSTPGFLKKIKDEVVRKYAKNLVEIWPTLAKKVKKDVTDNPDRYSLIYVPNGFIIPGGRFRELYYWDSYWIIKGLLICEMRDTVKGMLENLLLLVKRYGFVPNGSRVYYLNRSQPPLLTLMVRIYIDATNDLKWLRKNVQTLDRELTWWLTNRTVSVVKNGVNYTLARYGCDSTTPRPESYYEDLKTCREVFRRRSGWERCHIGIKSAAESGWDFSSRWIFDSKGGINATLSDIQTTRVIPVDLNAFLCKAFADLSYLYLKIGHTSKVTQWKAKADEWKNSILMVLYNQEDGIWYDYDLNLRQARKIFYSSNLTPLWAKAYVGRTLSDEVYGSRAVKYLKDQGVDKYKGGTPASLTESGEQWDLPNAWPPIQEIVILGLRETGQKDAIQLAKEFSTRWIEANMKGFQENDNKMFEKYDAIKPGQYGGGGEYPVQTGFGWSNGIALSLINVYYTGDNM